MTKIIDFIKMPAHPTKEEYAILKILKERGKLDKAELESHYSERGYKSFDKYFDISLFEEVIKLLNGEYELTEIGRARLLRYKKDKGIEKYEKV